MSRAAPPTWSSRGPPTVQQSSAPPTVAASQAQQPPAWKSNQREVQAQQQQQYDDVGSDIDESTGLPSTVASYLSELYQAMVDNDVAAVRYLYFKKWKEITKSYYAQSEWPSAEEVAPLCDENEVFLLCYRELCNRHIFMNTKPTLMHRFSSWNNYRALFDMFLDGATTSKLLLPLEWLNDMIDEFLYQWQDFAGSYRHYRGKDQTDLEFLRENPNLWKVQTVLGYLTSFVERSQIARDLNTHVAQQGAQAQSQTTQYSILKALGAFSIVGLCRAHVLLADYRYALKVLDPVDIDDQRAIFTQVTPCAITLFSHLGFAYMMCKRYADALQVFTRILVSHRTNKDSSTSFAEEHIINKHDKTLALAGLCHVLSPGVRIDEQIRRNIGDKFERLVNIQNAKSISDETFAVFEELFMFACPKFINPATPAALLPKVDGVASSSAVPTVKESADPRKEFVRNQLKWFLEDARQQLSLPMIRSYLKMYKSIPADKLSRFCQTEPEQFRQNLIFVKARSSQVVRGISDGSAPIEGVRTTVSDVHFYMIGDKNPSNDMVHIVSDITSSRQQYNAKFFALNAVKFQSTIADLQRETKRGDEAQEEDVDDM